MKNEIDELNLRREELEKGTSAPGKVEIVKRDKEGKITLLKVPSEQVELVTVLLKARKALGLSQSDFAKLLSTPKSTYIKYEQYVNRPPGAIIKLAKIAEKNRKLVEAA